MRISTLIIGLCFFIATINGQTVTKVHTQSGAVKELKPYSSGIILISEDDVADRVVYSLDGISGFTVSQDLVKGTGKELTAFSDDNLAMFIGDANDGLGLEIHKISNGVATSIIDHNGEGFEGEPGSFLGRFNDGFSNLFFYSFQVMTDVNGEMMENGNDLWYTDGENWNTGSISKPDPNFRLKNMAGMTELNGRIYFGGAIRPAFGFRVDHAIYSLPLSNLWDQPQEEFFFIDHVGLTEEVKSLISTDNDVYCLFDPTHMGYHSLFRKEEISAEAPEGLYRMIPFVTVNRNDVPRDNVSAHDGMISIGSKLYCVMSTNTTFESVEYEPGLWGVQVAYEEEKLYVFEGREATQLSNINGDDTDDMISELTLSDEKIFFFSGDGADKKLYYHDTVLGGTHLAGDAAFGAKLTAITNGVAYSTGEGAVMEVKVSNGAVINTVTMTGDYAGEVSHIMSNGNNVYVAHVNGTDTHISQFSSDIPAGIQKEVLELALKMGPNPVKDQLCITSNTAIVQVEVYDMLGKQVLEVEGDDLKVIQVSKLNKGLYLIKLNDIKGTVHSSKVYKE